MLNKTFFNRDATKVAKELLGKVLRVRYGKFWLSAMIIETEAYYLREKASHASLGFTEKRKALFMPAATIYMYHSRAGDSLNISCRGKGNAVLIKSGIPFQDAKTAPNMLAVMHELNPTKNNSKKRSDMKLCAGQALLCKSLNLKIKKWNQQQFDPQHFYIEDVGYRPEKILVTTRLGITKGRDEHLLLRFIDFKYAAYCTDNPLNKRNSPALQILSTSSHKKVLY